MSDEVEVIICGVELVPACCSFATGDGFITAAAYEAEGEEVLAAPWRCAGHATRSQVICGRPDVPPMAPGWTHKRWTGHAFKPRSRWVRVPAMNP